MRKTLARHVPALDEALRRNAANLSAMGQAINVHLQGMRVEAESARHQVEIAARKPSSSPSPGM